MQTNNRNHAAMLFNLQLIDVSIGKMKVRMNEIDHVLSSDESVAQATHALHTAEETIKPLEAQALDLELENKALVAKIQEADVQLYSGKVTNPKILTEMQMELDSLKRRLTTMDETLLTLMMTVEAQRAQIIQLRAAVQAELAQQVVRQSDLVKDKQQIADDIRDAIRKRKESIAQIEPTYVKAYDALRVRMKGSPVAQLREENCGICGVEQTSMLLQQLRQGNHVIYCGSCGRILAAL